MLSLFAMGDMGKIKRKGCLAGGEEEACTGGSHHERAVFLRTDQMKLWWLLSPRTTFRRLLRSEIANNPRSVFAFLACHVGTDSSQVLEVAGNCCAAANTNKPWRDTRANATDKKPFTKPRQTVPKPKQEGR